MAYLWENYDISNKYVLAKKNFCPYTEIFNIVSGCGKVNILYRFHEVYEYLSEYIKQNISSSDSSFDDMFNVLFHILANIDFYSGITKKDIYMQSIYGDIINGYYGINLDLFNRLEHFHLYKIISYMYIRNTELNRRNLFFDCISEIFDAKFYYSNYYDTYIVEVDCSKEKEYGDESKYTAEALYNLVKEFLCDFWINSEVYWEKPIGIIGDYMEIDNMQIV